MIMALFMSLQMTLYEKKSSVGNSQFWILGCNNRVTFKVNRKKVLVQYVYECV